MFWEFVLILSFILLYQLNFASCEEYNLFGIPGQGYLVEVNLGHPHQKLNVLVDTGSSTLAVASKPRSDISRYFHLENSSSLFSYDEEVHAKYTEGNWIATLVTDYIQFPSLSLAPEVMSDIAMITSAHEFFMNGSGWQGILGLAYPAVAAVGRNAVAKPWLEAVDRQRGKTTSFSLKLCGVHSPTNASHYGSFMLYDNVTANLNHNRTFRTPILQERWYEIGILSVRVINKPVGDVITQTTIEKKDSISVKNKEINENVCRELNSEKSILDSGTTNLRLPKTVFRNVVDQLRNSARASNIIILDEFWYRGTAACWPEPRDWSMPWLAIDLLNADSDQQYFTLELPPKNYMRLVSAHSGDGSVSELCYKLGLESGVNTVLGVAAFEGLQVLFNKADSWIGFQTSDCGPEARITGPYNTTEPLSNLCHLAKPTRSTAVETIKVAQWSVAVALTIAMTLLLYLMAPCIRAKCISSLRRAPTQISLSRATLVAMEST